MKRYIYIFCIAIFFSACEKEDNHYSSSLIGEWAWLKSCGGFAGGCNTPQSLNINVRLVFTMDSTYNQYINDNLEIISDFHTYKIIGSDTVNIIEFDDIGIQKSFAINHDTLFLNDYFMSDGYLSYYRRIK